MSLAHDLALTPHPATPCDVVRAIEVQVRRGADGTLSLQYTLEGDVSRLRLPPPRPARRADRLWQHTCFEAFIAKVPGSAYIELNFSPSGEWAGYAFDAYRSGMAVAEDIEAPKIGVTRGDGSLSVQVSVSLACLRGGAAARIALAAVVESSSGSLSYWAIEHPTGKPDFHHARGFALQV